MPDFYREGEVVDLPFQVVKRNGEVIEVLLSAIAEYDDQGRLHRQTDKGIRTTKAASWDAVGGWAPWFDWGKRTTKIPGRSRFISGNFVFTLGQWNVEVPQDPAPQHSIAQQFWDGEPYTLQVDSHMKFEPTCRSGLVSPDRTSQQ